MGEIAHSRGDLDGALRRYREAMARHGRGAAPRIPTIRRRLFDHAQNVFWVGSIALSARADSTRLPRRSASIGGWRTG